MVRIVHLPVPAIDALAAGDAVAASQLSGLALGPEFADARMQRTWRRRSQQLAEHPEDEPWITGIILDGGTAVGRAGYHGPPKAGLVEVGYEVLPAYRRRGYARAALAALISRAEAEPGISTLRASISPDNAASLATIAAWPFTRTGEEIDDEDGVEFVFDLRLAGIDS